ncbi:DUF599 domain-containing protein [Methylobacterium frigidaeris]|uniref:DUF599 domain-containing protein n=1 Tax=Methylobacterium frigidaeris TaxID=2038277 RepID=A0AA37H7A5_9HYPH|nr:DUF599 domain-containing protein [Methylobacterium frigidaeris]PIK70431.1 hypothetical protein CS379_24685 [Methylobacterium frigidaeris]GJD60141.1 hypothetical protein MPEAHAMD_0276 [Methylobacterium frigidaeris]
MHPDLGLSSFSFVDLAALIWFLAAWFGYSYAVEHLSGGKRSLNGMMNRYRHAWADQQIVRENRVVDTTINASLQNGTAFFASTALIALGSALTLSRSADDALTLFSTLPFGAPMTRAVWEIKVAGLALIFVYAFFKFAWAYRLFNYGAILIGAVPPRGGDPARIERAARRAAAMNVVAGGHFNRGQRAFFFALAYLGWFVSAYVLFVTTAMVLTVMWQRQFASDARRALQDYDDP